MNNWLVQCDSKDGGCDAVYPGDMLKCPKCGASTCLIAIPIMLPDDVLVYDLETYPNCFTCAILKPNTNERWLFEISDRKNEIKALIQMLDYIMDAKLKMVGFNNCHFDYAFLHAIIGGRIQLITAQAMYQITMEIIKPSAEIRSKYPWGKHNFRENDYVIKQIDLFKIRHFDNKARSTSLKSLEIMMRMKNVQDLPFPVGSMLTDEQKDELIHYNWHDVDATTLFLVRTIEEIKFREKMSEKYNVDFTNYNDVRMGSKIFQMKLESAGIACYENGKVRQTHKARIHLHNCVPDYVEFEHPEFNRMLETFKRKILIGDNVKSLFTGLHCTINALDYHYGAGGLHASVKGVFESDENYVIEDIDVGGMYPAIIAANGYFPEHLGEKFSPIFRELIEERKRVGKKTPMGAALKLAANGTFGKLADKYSFLYDLTTLLQVTITGQLVLSMLVDQLIKIPNLMIIQCNTDGITYRVPRAHQPMIKNMISLWEDVTGLEMEYAEYSRMWIADVNNYIAEYVNGDLKRKGRYEYEVEYHQDPSQLVIAKAAEAYMVHGQEIEDFIYHHRDMYDFMLRAKVPRSNTLVVRWAEGFDVPLGSIIRYYVTKRGGLLFKIAPPRGKPGEYKRANSLTDAFYNQVKSEIGEGVWDERIHTKNRSTYGENVETGLSAKNLTMDCSDKNDFDWNNLNYDYYIKKAKAIIIGEIL